MSALVLCIAGRIASGKSTIASALGQALHLRVLSFGNYVRNEAERMGLEETKKNLQNLGERLVAPDPLEFTRGFLAKSAWIVGESVVIDGLRHIQVLRSLQNLTVPSEVLLLYVDADDQTRWSRHQARHGGSKDQFDEAEAHPVERQVPLLLKKESTLVLDGTEPVPKLVSQVRSFLAQREKRTSESMLH